MIIIIWIFLNAGSPADREKNPQGSLYCTCAITQENVEEACKREGAQNILATLDQQHNKYKLIESQLARSLQSMHGKIPEIEKTLQMIEALSQSKSINCFM